MRDGLRASAQAVDHFMAGCEALRGTLGHEVVAEHLDLTLKRMGALRQDLRARAEGPSSEDSLFIALGLGSAAMGSLAIAFTEMHRRYRATLPGSQPPMGLFVEVAEDTPF